MLHPVSLILPCLVLIPNLLFLGAKPVYMPEGRNKENPILAVAEGIGRLGVLILPVFWEIHLEKTYELIVFIGMIGSILFYYAGWIRYFTKGREYKLLFAPLLRIPVPLAISPVLYFSFAAIILHSPILLIASLILAVGHIPMSLAEYNR